MMSRRIVLATAAVFALSSNIALAADEIVIGATLAKIRFATSARTTSTVTSPSQRSTRLGASMANR